MRKKKDFKSVVERVMNALAVQNALDLRDMGAGTSAATFFRSLGGSVGVAALGAVMNSKLSEQMSGSGMAGVSINAPAEVRKLPPQVLDAVEHVFVNALHPVFFAAAIVAFVGTVIAVALPDKPLQDSAHAPETVSEAEMEAKAAAF